MPRPAVKHATSLAADTHTHLLCELHGAAVWACLFCTRRRCAHLNWVSAPLNALPATVHAARNGACTEIYMYCVQCSFRRIAALHYVAIISHHSRQLLWYIRARFSFCSVISGKLIPSGTLESSFIWEKIFLCQQCKSGICEGYYIFAFHNWARLKRNSDFVHKLWENYTEVWNPRGSWQLFSHLYWQIYAFEEKNKNLYVDQYN